MKTSAFNQSCIAGLSVLLLAAGAAAQSVKLSPVTIDPKTVETGTNKMITPAVAFLSPAEEAGVDPELFRLDGEAFVTSVTIDKKICWVGVTVKPDGTKQYALVSDGMETHVKDGPATTWSRSYTELPVHPADSDSSGSLFVRATGNPPLALRYFLPVYDEGQWTPKDSDPIKVGVFTENGKQRLLLDLDGDDSYRFKSPTMEVRDLDSPFKLQGQAYTPRFTAEGTSLEFTAVDDADAPELAVLRYGATAPDWVAQDFDGKAVKLSDFRGKFVFFDVWATWCGPCLGEIPHIQEAQEKFGDKVHIIGVSIDGEVDLPKKMAADKKLTYNQLWTPGEFKSAICQQYQVNGIPATFLIGPDGKLVAKSLRGDSISKALEMASKMDTPEAKQYFAETTERAQIFDKVQNLVESGQKAEAVAMLKDLKERHKDPDGLETVDRYLQFLDKP